MTNEKIIVGYVTDVEGNFEYWQNYIRTSKVLIRREGSLILNDNCHFVYGGDVVDRGLADVRILNELIDLKHRYFDRVHFIMGNRDTNKMRWPVSLHPWTLSGKPETYWFRNPDPSVLDEYKLNNRVDKVKWVLKYNMGSPHSFEYRKQELQDLGLPSDDESVVDSYLKLIEPDGLLTKYLELSKICVIIGDVVFVHGAFHEYNMGWVPSAAVPAQSAQRFRKEEELSCGGYYIESLKEWAECINNFAHNEVMDYKRNIRDYIKRMDNAWSQCQDCERGRPVDPSIPVASLPSSTTDIPWVWESHGGYVHEQPGTRLIQYGQGWMPDKSLNLGVIYCNYLQDGQPLPVGERLKKWLIESGVTKVIVGHQPNGDAPLVIRSECKDGTNVYILSGDTSYSRNAHYRIEDLKHVAMSPSSNAADDRTTELSEWMSLDQYSSTVLGEPSLGPLKETRHPSTISEILVTFPLLRGHSIDSLVAEDYSVPSTVVIYGRTSQSATYAFSLGNTVREGETLNKYLGKMTKDGWHVKAYGVTQCYQDQYGHLNLHDLQSVWEYATEERAADPNRFYLLIHGEYQLFKQKFVAEHLIQLEF